MAAWRRLGHSDTGHPHEAASSFMPCEPTLLRSPSSAPVGSPSRAASSLNPNPHLSSGTTLAGTLVVRGQHSGDYPPGGSDPTIKLATLPPLPWKAEARSPSGRVLTSLVVQ